MSMKNSNDINGNWTRDLPIFSAVPQPTALPRAPHWPSGYHDSGKKNRCFFARLRRSALVLCGSNIQRSESRQLGTYIWRRPCCKWLTVTMRVCSSQHSAAALQRDNDSHLGLQVTHLDCSCTDVFRGKRLAYGYLCGCTCWLLVRFNGADFRVLMV